MLEALAALGEPHVAMAVPFGTGAAELTAPRRIAARVRSVAITPKERRAGMIRAAARALPPAIAGYVACWPRIQNVESSLAVEATTNQGTSGCRS